MRFKRGFSDPGFVMGGKSEHDRAVELVEQVVLEQLSEYREELSTGEMKVIADQVSREAIRRLNDMPERAN